MNTESIQTASPSLIKNEIGHTYDRNNETVTMPIKEYEWFAKALKTLLDEQQCLPSNIIIGIFIDKLRNCATIEQAIAISEEWVFDHNMINNVRDSSKLHFMSEDELELIA